MKRLFARAGVDYVQWKAVSRTLIRGDFRSPVAQDGTSYSLRSVFGVIGMAAVFGLFGLASVVLIALNPDVLLTGTVTLAILAFGLATALLTHHGATLLSAADHAILGPRPVSSQTFFAIRLTNVLFHAGLITTFMAYPPVIAYAFAHGGTPGRALAAAVAIYAWAVTVTFVVVAAYAALLRRVGGARLQRVVAYAQLAAGVVTYGVYFVALETLGRAALASARLPESWAWALPPAWFASLIEIAAGVATVETLVRAAMAIACLVSAAAVLRGRLALDYVERLAEPPQQDAVAAPSTARVPWIFGRYEGRAVALLAAAHVRHDLRVRMGLFGVVPLIAIYVIVSLQQGGNPDPFAGGRGTAGVDVLGLTALMFPAIVLRQLETSDAFRAAWIYEATPAHGGRLVLAMKNVAALGLLGPFAALLAVVLAWRFGHLGHALAHTALLTGIAHLALQIAVLIRPRLPFSQPPIKSDSVAIFVWLAVVMIGGQLFLVAVQRMVYPSWPRLALFFVALACLSALLEKAVRWRVRMA